MEQSIFKSIIHSSNLCTEILLPTEAATQFHSKATENISTGIIVTTTTEVSGLTALCNLSSINVLKWYHMTNDERHAVAKELLEASDNLIECQHYPTPDGEIFNRNYRAIGIGQNNTAQLFASLGLKYSDPASLEISSMIARTIHEVFTYESAELAKVRGNFKWMHKTKRTGYARFATLFSIAPTATSSLIIDATEGTEPVSALLSEKTGTGSSKQLVPQLQTLGSNYELAGVIPTKALYLHAQARNEYLDQGQSINTYAKDPTSAAEVINDIILAESLGLTALYYLQSATALEGCDSCGS